MPFSSANFSREELTVLVYALPGIGMLSGKSVDHRIGGVGEVTEGG